MIQKLALTGLSLILASTASAQEVAWRSYSNARFGLSCAYPALFTRHDPAPDNGDGQTFHTGDGSATLRVFGFYNIDHASTATLLAAQKRSGFRPAYTMARKDRFAYSGTHGATEVYLRCNLGSGDVIGCVELTYPSQATTGWPAIVTRVSQSLRVP